MYIKAEQEKIYINALRMSIASLTGILVGPKVLSVTSQTSNYISWGREGPIFSCRLIMK